MDADIDVDLLLSAVDIKDYISQYCDLELRSDGEYWGLSPLKNEKTPSFSVNTDLQRFYDFSSGNGGTLIQFIEAYESCSYAKAIEILKEYAKISPDGTDGSQHLVSTMVAKKFKRPNIRTKESAKVVLKPDYMDQFDFREDKLELWVKEGISLTTMKHFGVKYDLFSDRIVFPIKSTDGTIINVSGRTLDPLYKEKGIRKYTYFKPLGKLDTLYAYSDNLDAIKKAGEIILFEGAKSVMLAYEWGIYNTAAILTSHLNYDQLVILIKLGVDVVFALDEDVDVRKDPNIHKLRRYTQVYTVQDKTHLLDEKMSPVDKGLDTWRTLYEGRIALY